MKPQVKRRFFADDGGFSTVGMVLALLISVSLVLGATQVYRIRSVSADIQNVADACALAAQNQVASFYLVAQVCDCAVFSMSFAGTATVGLGIVAACIPPAESLSVKLVEAGKRILDARTRFARSCSEGLNRLQTLLPLFAAIDAASLAQANSTAYANYHAIAVLAPFQGEDLAAPDTSESDSLVESVENDRDAIASAAQRAEEARRAASGHKHAAFMADCGADPGYCMYERASTLVGLGGQDNPCYRSADAWSFSVAMNRARAYYWQRYLSEAPASDAVDEMVRSAARMRFYAYAVDALAEGYVYETDETFNAFFPLLPRNTDEMRSTRLYTEAVWPVTEHDNGDLVMHGFDGCPAAAEGTYAGVGSLAQMEEEGFAHCGVCGFAASSVGKVAAASTSIDNGFEYHYQIVAREAALYQQEHAKATELEQAARGPAQRLFDKLKELFSAAKNSRIAVQPPGRIGAIAVVYETGGYSASDVVPNSLVASTAPLGARVAISAATLAHDDSDEAETVISSLLDGVLAEVAAASVVDAAFDLWSSLLVSYTRSTHALTSGVASALDSLPFVGGLGLGAWASGKLTGIIEDAGLAPPDVVSRKPVVVNTYHVASAEGGTFCRGLVSAKQAVSQAYGGIASDPLSALVGIAGGRLLASYESWDATFVIARIELFGEGGVSIPLEITLPPAIKEAGQGVIERALDMLLATTGELVEVRRWE